ncbi:OB-fold domain-containing protein [Alphaproteobacteria bacterium]|nr:OB-fold domain-containing protein [Alphaproteobacteria bacterium]
MAEYLKALPIPSPETETFWAGAKEHKLKIQKCHDCAGTWFPPATLCAHCGSHNHDWIDASGLGKIHSFVTYHRIYHKGWEGELPYVVAIIELAEGARLAGNIIGTPVEEIVCDMEVKVMFDDVTDDVTIPKFQPA